MKRIEHLLKLVPDTQVHVVHAWVRSKRVGKQVSFLMVNDGSCLESLQVVIGNYQLTETLMKQLTVGSSCRIEGVLVASKGSQSVELQLHDLQILGNSPEDYPLQKKYHSMEFLRTIAHLRPRTNTFGAIMRVRSQIACAVHQFFQYRQFIYLHSPIITGSDAEGGGELFTVNSSLKEDFFGREAYLTVTGQLEAEAYACSLGSVYTFGPTFRAENSQTARHAAEFWMVEPEVAFCSFADIIQLGQDLIRFLIYHALLHCRADLNFLLRDHPEHFDALERVLVKPFIRLTYTDAIEILLSSGVNFNYPVAWGADLQAEHERYLAEHVYQHPIALIHHPRELKAFYMKQNDDFHTVQSVDFLLGGIGEVLGGSQREESYSKLLEVMQERKMDITHYQWYLDLRRYGSVPHGGFGMGFERFLQYLMKIPNIRDVISFPRTIGLSF